MPRVGRTDLESEADQAQGDGGDHLEPTVGAHLLLEQLGQPHLSPDVLPDPAQAEHPQHEPQLQRAKPAAQRNLPVLPSYDKNESKQFTPLTI